MLKFLRKYQLFILAIGGSLLMVVFLLQPILGQLAPNPDNKTVAQLARDGRDISAGDRRIANLEIQDLADMLPALVDVFEIDRDAPGDHWLLLTHAADAAGLVGADNDGVAWLDQLVLEQTALAIRQFQMRGQFLSAEEQEDLVATFRQRFDQARSTVAARRRIPMIEVDRMLARARGVARLRELHALAPRISDRRLLDAAKSQGAAAIADAVLLEPSLIAATLEDPSDEEMREHLARYGEVRPGDTDDNPFGLGYRLPDRVQLEWLVLDMDIFEAVAEVDRVELRKRWQRANPDGTTEDFAADRPELEAELRTEAAERIMEEADQVVRGELLRLIRPLDSEGQYKVVPEDWPAAGPDFERIAQVVVRQVQERLGVRIPAPSVNRRTDRWLNRQDIARIPGLGQAAFRIGAQQVPVTDISQHVREINESELLPAQVGLPILDPYATDASDRHYYVTVLDARAESAPESLDVVIDSVRTNMRILAAYDRLVELAEPARLVAAESGLEAAVGFVAAEARISEDATLPTTFRDLIVFTGGTQPAEGNQRPPQALGSTDFSEAILEVARTLDPLSPIDSGDPERTAVAAPLPRSRAVALANVRAVRPLTAEAYRARADGLVNSLITTESDEIVPADAVSPFSLDALAARLGYDFDYRADRDAIPNEG